MIRNRLRRQIREVFRKLWPSLTPGYSLVVVVQAAAVGLTSAAITSQVQLLLERAEVLGGDSGRSVI